MSLLILRSVHESGTFHGITVSGNGMAYQAILEFLVAGASIAEAIKFFGVGFARTRQVLNEVLGSARKRDCSPREAESARKPEFVRKSSCNIQKPTHNRREGLRDAGLVTVRGG